MGVGDISMTNIPGIGDDTLWCVDDDGHGIYALLAGREVLRTIGTPGQVAPGSEWSALQQADKTRSASRQ
jgi:hypothetical protein